MLELFESSLYNGFALSAVTGISTEDPTPH